MTEQNYLEVKRQFQAAEKEVETANARAAEIQTRLDEEKARLPILAGKKKDAARQYASGGSPVALNKVQGEIADQQGLIEGLEETLGMVNEVVIEKKQALIAAEQALEDAHSEYWRETEKQLLNAEFEHCKKVLITAWRAARASGLYMGFNDYTRLFFNEVHSNEASDYPIEPGKVPEDFSRSSLLNYKDRAHV